MKTKHILTALALPAMFAACTADDIVSVDNGALQMPERALLSEDFVLNINKGVESRYQVTGTTSLDFEFEANDSIGANLIDQPFDAAGNLVDDPAEWVITPYVAPALPFVNNGGDAWTSAGRLGVGNYLFTNPYNPADGGRLAAKVELPRLVQYSSENPNAVIEQYNKAVAATVMREGDMMANISLKNLYTYPKVRINFPNSEEVSKITKVVLAKENGGTFLYKTGLDHEYIAHMFKPETIKAWLEANEGKTEEDYWATIHTTHFILDGVDGVSANTETNDGEEAAANTTIMDSYGKPDYVSYIIYEMSEPVVSYGKTKGIEVRLMLPSTENFNNYDVVIYVCTDNGNYAIDFNGSGNGDMKFNEGTVPAKIKNALLRNTSNTLNTEPLTLPGHAAPSNLNFGNAVTNINDWNSLVARYGDLEKHNGKGDGVNGIHAPLAVTILNDEFTFTEEAEMPEVAIFTIDKPVKIEGDVTLKNVRTTANVIVKANSTLTTAQTFQAATVTVEKGGNLVVTEALNEDKEVIVYGEVDEEKIANEEGVEGITKVVNEGKVTVKTGAVAMFELDNKFGGELNVEAAASRAADAAGHAYLKGKNYGLVNNKGIVTTFEEFTNHAPFEGEEGKGYEWNKEDKVWEGAPTIKNDGTFNAKGTVINYGKFENNLKLSSNFGSDDDFANATSGTQTEGKVYVGTLAIAEDATTEIDSNTGALIVLADPNPSALKIFDEAVGTIQYTLTDKVGQIDLSTSPVNYLIATGNVDLQKTFWNDKGTEDDEDDERAELETLVMLNGGSIKIAATTLDDEEEPVELALVKTLIVKGNSTISGTVNSVDAIQIAEKVTLEVPVGARLEIASDDIIAGVDSKNGTLQVNGALKVEDLTSDATTAETIASKAMVTNKMVTWGKEAVLAGTLKVDSSAADAATALQTKYNKALANIWNQYIVFFGAENELDALSKEHEVPWYWNPTDIDWFASELNRHYDEDVAPDVKILVNALFGDNLATGYTALKGNKKVAAIKAKLNAENFAAAVTSSIYWTTKTQWNVTTDEAMGEAKETLKAEFIDADGLFTDAATTEIEQSDVVYKTETEAYKSVLANFSKPANGDEVAKYANVWNLITADGIKAALLDEDAKKFNGVEGQYVFVWEDCDLDKVVAKMAEFSVQDWVTAYPALIAYKTVEGKEVKDDNNSYDTANKLYTIEGIKKFLQVAALTESNSPVVDGAAIANTYYSASQTWEYSSAQVAALAGAHKVVLSGIAE